MIPITIRCLRCSETGRSEIILERGDQLGLGILGRGIEAESERLYATVFEGSPAEGLDRDNEAAGYWEQYLPKDHILNGNKHDNFWEMGDTGPCGPCSEIHIDLRSDEERAAVSGADMVNKDHPQVIEIWTLCSCNSTARPTALWNRCRLR